MSQSLTERLQSTRLTVVAVDPARNRVRVRGEADVCSEITCGEQTLVLGDEVEGGLKALQPGDIVKIEPAGSQPQRIVIVRRAWDETASPEI
jgi:hypothetical protein